MKETSQELIPGKGKGYKKETLVLVCYLIQWYPMFTCVNTAH